MRRHRSNDIGCHGCLAAVFAVTLRKIESSLSQIVVALHDLARGCTNPAIESRLRRIAHEVNLAADRVRRLLASVV